MFDPTLNAAVVTMSGVFIGGATFVANALDPASEHGRPPKPPPLFRRGYFKAMREQQKAQEAARALAPRSYNVAIAAFAGMIAVVVLGIYFSPVHMRWAFFVGGLFLGFATLNGVFTLALKGQLNIRTPAFLERLGVGREVAPPAKAESESTGAPQA